MPNRRFSQPQKPPLATGAITASFAGGSSSATALQRLGRHVHQRDAQASVEKVHGDATPHRARTDHAHMGDAALGRVVGHIGHLGGRALGREHMAQGLAFGCGHEVQKRLTLKRRAFIVQADAPMQEAQDVFASTDPSQPCGRIAQAASVAGAHVAIAELQLAALDAGRLHLGAVDGPVLQRLALPYPLREDI